MLTILIDSCMRTREAITRRSFFVGLYTGRIIALPTSCYDRGAAHQNSVQLLK